MSSQSQNIFITIRLPTSQSKKQPITKTDNTPSPNEIGETSTKLLIGKLLAGSLAGLVPVWGYHHSKRSHSQCSLNHRPKRTSVWSIGAWGYAEARGGMDMCNAVSLRVVL